MQGLMAAATPGALDDWQATRLLAWMAIAALVLLLAPVALHTATMIRLNLGAARARRLLARHAVETSALAAGQECRIAMPGLDERTGRGVIEAIGRRLVTIRVHCQGVSPRAGSPIEVTVIGRSAAYRFLSIVRGFREGPGASAIVLARPPWVEKIQRREYFRVPIEAPTSVTARGPGQAQPITMACTIKDLSAGGVRLVCPAPLPTDTFLAIRVPTSAESVTRFEARVRSCGAECGSTDRFVIGCEFDRMDEDTRNRLVNYCFDLERSARAGRRQTAQPA